MGTVQRRAGEKHKYKSGPGWCQDGCVGTWSSALCSTCGWSVWEGEEYDYPIDDSYSLGESNDWFDVAKRGIRDAWDYPYLRVSYRDLGHLNSKLKRSSPVPSTWYTRIAYRYQEGSNSKLKRLFSVQNNEYKTKSKFKRMVQNSFFQFCIF
eukprot:TRINITY_DN37013_c0_g1_i1.p1 TRINITY_DN37013_c0_g1~~TRINITY_DN37013_c0_g1_i1.p1  ORF type:complete len:163 (-),score=24.12 TRINITY_DN37013_c0_g1_i1:18-473(-)